MVVILPRCPLVAPAFSRSNVCRVCVLYSARFRHTGDHYARMLAEMERWFGMLDNPAGLGHLLEFIHVNHVCSEDCNPALT